RCQETTNFVHVIRHDMQSPWKKRTTKNRRSRKRYSPLESRCPTFSNIAYCVNSAAFKRIDGLPLAVARLENNEVPKPHRTFPARKAKNAYLIRRQRSTKSETCATLAARHVKT